MIECESMIGAPATFGFDTALVFLKRREKPLRRVSWPKDKFVVCQKGYPDGIHCNKQTAEAWRIKEGDLFKCAPYMQIQENGTHYMWTPNTEDLFAEDWTLEY